MPYTLKSKSLQSRAGAYTLVPKETLHMLSVVLRTAFRTHCTGETVCAQSPWQLVQTVQEELAALSRESDSAVSEERLIRFLEESLARPSFPAERADPLVEAN